MAVDDEPVNLATIEQELKDIYDVVPMLTGRRAIKYLYRENVDLILMDVMMPIMDGIECLKEIRTLENGVTVPVVFLTGRKDAGTVIEGSKLGIMDYITKPFDGADLRNRIDQVFKRLGVLPMEQEELYGRITAIFEDMKERKFKPAISKADEVLRYQLDEEISGRMRQVKKKLENGEEDSAMVLIERVLTFMERDLDTGDKSVHPPISLAEITARLLYVKDDITNFKLKDANEKLASLKDYDIPETTRRYVNLSMDRLKDYDEEEAVSIIDKAIAGLNANLATGHEQEKPEDIKDTSSSSGGGYRSKFFSKK